MAPDSNPSRPGVQLKSPLPVIVKRIGPKPTTINGNTGYLNMGIWGAGYVSVLGKIIVPDGSWKAEEPLGNNLEMISGTGTTCHACLENVENSKLTVNDDRVTIGRLDKFTPRGFMIEDEVLVRKGVDATTVHLNWNDIKNTVENRGEGMLDAEYNWWGDLDPSDDIDGEVDYRPFLPEEACKFAEYMRKKDIESPRAAVAGRMLQNESCSRKLPSRMIVKYNLRPKKAERIVEEYGCFKVRRAIKYAGRDFESFISKLS